MCHILDLCLHQSPDWPIWLFAQAAGVNINAYRQGIVSTALSILSIGLLAGILLTINQLRRR
jgi:hypothetical protein